MKRSPLRIVKKHKPIEKQVLFVEEYSTPKKLKLKAFMSDAFEQKGEEIEKVEEQEIAPKVEEETFMLLEGPESKIVATSDIPEDLTLMTETEMEQINVILDVKILFFVVFKGSGVVKVVFSEYYSYIYLE